MIIEDIIDIGAKACLMHTHPEVIAAMLQDFFHILRNIFSADDFFKLFFHINHS